MKNKVSENIFKVLFDATPGLLLVLDSELSIVTANQTYVETTGIDLSKITGKNVFSSFPEIQSSAAELALEQSTESLQKVRKTLVPDSIYCKCEKYNRILRVVNRPLLNENGTLAFIIHRLEDVTELMHAKELAEAASLAKSAFLANMSHEIRTPLAAIVGFTDFLLDPEITSAEARSSIFTIKRNGEHLTNIVNEILDLSKIEAGHMEIEFLSFEVADVVEYVESVLSYKARAKGIALNFEIGPDVPLYVKTDPTRLRQVLLNIVGNAVKFTNTGGVMVKLGAVSKNGKSYLEFFVHDTGEGVSAEQQKRLFEPFMQADNSHSRKFGGTGLGLALSKKLVMAMGGDLELLESTPQGSTFKITIENGEVPQVLQEYRGELQIAEDVSFEDLRVLIVEDSIDNQVILQLLLKPTHAKIQLANDGVEGIEKAMHSDFDLVLMDVQMPRMDGYSAIKQLRANGFRKPVIALTAHALKADRELAFSAGFDDHLSKPINKHALINAIAHYTSKPVSGSYKSGF